MARRFASTVDLLALLSEKIHNRNLLFSLCLANRAFNAIFSRQLYKCLRLDDRNIDFFIDPEKLHVMTQSGNLAHTRVIIILGSATKHVQDRAMEQRLILHGENWATSNWKSRELIFIQVNQALVDILKHAPGLKSFACQRLGIASECWDALSMCTNLQSLAIGFRADCNAQYKRRSKDSHEPVLVFRDAEPKLTTFTRLQRLSLQQIWGDIPSWKPRLLQVLLHSPHLKHVSLSVSLKTSTMYAQGQSPTPPLERGSNPCKRFFEELATQYAETQERPLNLKSIRLSGRIAFPNMAATAKSINWDELEEFHMENTDSLVHYDELADAFGSYFPPKLRIFSFRERGPNSRQFLPSLIDSARNSAIGDEFGIISSGDTDLAPRLLASTLGQIEDGNIVMAMFPLDKTQHGYKTILPQLPVPYFATSLAIKAPPYVEDSDDVSLDLPRFCESLANLTMLKALWIMRPSFLGKDNYIHPTNIDRNGMIYANISGQRVEGSEKWRQSWSVQGCTLAAEQISKASRSLRYIRIGIQAWRIWRKDADESAVSLEALDEWEDEVEGPDFFHVPFPLPWNSEMRHVDWRYTGY